MCDTCVAKYDHHCAWLNSDVGLNNYRYFLLFLISHVGICVYGCYLCAMVLWGVCPPPNRPPGGAGGVVAVTTDNGMGPGGIVVCVPAGAWGRTSSYPTAAAHPAVGTVQGGGIEVRNFLQFSAFSRNFPAICRNWFRLPPPPPRPQSPPLPPGQCSHRPGVWALGYSLPTSEGLWGPPRAPSGSTTLVPDWGGGACRPV